MNIFKLIGVAPAKIIFMVILSFEVVLVSSPNIIIATKKSKQTSVTALVSLLFIAIIPISCKIKKNSLHYLFVKCGVSVYLFHFLCLSMFVGSSMCVTVSSHVYIFVYHCVVFSGTACIDL